MRKSTITTIIIIVILVLVGIYFLFIKSPASPAPSTETPTPVASVPGVTQATSSQGTTLTNGATSVIGKSVQGSDILAYHYGKGSTEILLIGGIHGGYEWNTVLVAREAADYLKSNPDAIPSDVRVTIIPVLNPDGLTTVLGADASDFSASDVPSSQALLTSGRFNANRVDLNRNFDCDWQAKGTWQSTTVSGGKEAFSEPESQAIKQYIETNKPVAVLVWFSAAGGVYASNCHTGVSTETKAITKAYADASGYPAYQSFDFYATTGDITNWLAKSGIPAVSVLLTNHTDTEWSKNKLGIQALLKYYSK